MFQIREGKLPADPTFPDELSALGFFVAGNDSLRRIDDPTTGFRYRISNDERVKDVHFEKVCECLRTNILSRLTSTGSLSTLCLPHLTEEKPANEAHLPIICTPPKALRSKSRVIVIINDTASDLAIWSWSAALSEEKSSIAKASALAIANAIGCRAETADVEVPGLIILNPGQLLYSHKRGKAMTSRSWLAAPRASALHPPADMQHSHIAHNETSHNHLRYVLEHIIENSDFVSPNSGIYFIGLCKGGMCLLDVLQERIKHDETILGRISAIALTAPSSTISYGVPDVGSDDANARATAILHHFLKERGRGWDTSPHPVNTPISNPSLSALSSKASEEGKSRAQDRYYDIKPWPTLAGGNDFDTQKIFIESYHSILDWFEEVERDDIHNSREYVNDILDIPDFVIEERHSMSITDIDEGWAATGTTSTKTDSELVSGKENEDLNSKENTKLK